jgi:hypothetical protein
MAKCVTCRHWLPDVRPNGKPVWRGFCGWDGAAPAWTKELLVPAYFAGAPFEYNLRWIDVPGYEGCDVWEAKDGEV